ncbi:hypothetical protein B296_00005256 [Ensete ventricosum]|uniref:Uncharacterized protein n=1 Tax=Ensete ventricosum TaxID=4639 RepID=A0A427AKF1_ENSVE|nr:hypothetical protein B296_00005256 [Ensete ventricosum]
MQHYSLRPANSFISGSLHDLNTADSNPGEIEGISDVDREPVNEDSLDNDDDESNSVIIIDHFIDEHVIEAGETSDVGCYQGNEKVNKRKQREIQYEGDHRFALPLMYVANLYETLVNDVNVRLASLDGIREKNIGVALETAGGLYRRLAKKFPPKGCLHSLLCKRRRELATSLATRTRFPELVVQEEKRVRFVVVNARDYKFYSPRHKYKRGASHSMTNIPGLNVSS